MTGEGLRTLVEATFEASDIVTSRPAETILRECHVRSANNALP